MTGQPYSRRLLDLERRFEELAGELPDDPQKDAVSVLHGMIQELWRSMDRGSDKRGQADAAAEKGRTLVDIANLYRSAPGMGGVAEHEPLPVGSLAPDFTLRDANNEAVSLRDFRGRPVVLVFYPLDWSPTCSDQLSLYEYERSEFERHGAQLLAVSVDSIYSHGAWAAVRGLTFPLLADFEPKGDVARRYNVYRERDGFSERALYVIDGDGVIRYAHVSPQLNDIPDVYELFDVLRELTARAAPTEQASREPVPVGG